MADEADPENVLAAKDVGPRAAYRPAHVGLRGNVEVQSLLPT